MSSICKKKKKKSQKKGMKGRNRGCDQRTKIRCIYRHGSRPLGPNTMWRVSRKTNSASQRTAVCSSCERWNLPSKRSSESCLSIGPFTPDGGTSSPLSQRKFSTGTCRRPHGCVRCGSPLQLRAHAWVVTLPFLVFLHSLGVKPC